MVPLQCCNELMPEYKGRVNGIILGFFSMGSLMFNALIAALCNPNGVNPIKDGSGES